MAKQWHQLERLDHKALKKLQAEREKAAKLQAQKEKRAKAMVIGSLIFLVLIGLCVLAFLLKKKSDEKHLEEAREKLMYTNISEYSGSVEYRTDGDWTTLNANIQFKEDHIFRTSEESSIKILMQRDNQIKLCSSTEAQIKTPVIEEKEAQITKQVVELTKGELTTAISIDGRGILHIRVDDFTVIGKTGLFKILYDEEKRKGEVVVKNGLVEVSITGSTEKPVNLSGFYKVTFENGELSAPTQASVIQYDWK